MKSAVAFYRCVVLQEIWLMKPLVVQANIPMPYIYLWLFFFSSKEKTLQKSFCLISLQKGRKECLKTVYLSSKGSAVLWEIYIFPCLWSTWMKLGGRSNFDLNTCFFCCSKFRNCSTFSSCESFHRIVFFYTCFLRHCFFSHLLCSHVFMSRWKFCNTVPFYV